MHCVICGEHIDVSHPHVLPTTDRQWVHLTCAERQAQAAVRRRTLHALIIAVCFAGLWVTALLLGVGLQQGVVLALLLAFIHVATNRRWWYYIVQPARWWWRWR